MDAGEPLQLGTHSGARGCHGDNLDGPVDHALSRERLSGQLAARQWPGSGPAVDLADIPWAVVTYRQDSFSTMAG